MTNAAGISNDRFDGPPPPQSTTRKFSLDNLTAVTLPVLVCGFRRPDAIRRAIHSVIEAGGHEIWVSIDGPANDSSRSLVDECVRVSESFRDEVSVTVLTSDVNLGLRRAIPRAINWFFQQNENADVVFVLEDDVTLERQALAVAAEIQRYARHFSDIFAIGFHTLDGMSEDGTHGRFRKSRVSSSYAWLTWRDRWAEYDDSFAGAGVACVPARAALLGSRLSAIRWYQLFLLVRLRLISSWYYRWLDSVWSEGGYFLLPTKTLARYHGHVDGSNTIRPARWTDRHTVERTQWDFSTLVEFSADWDAHYHTVHERATILDVICFPLEMVALLGRNTLRVTKAFLLNP